MSSTDSPATGGQDRGVSTLELFFDLVFVYGITQVTAYLAADHSSAGFVQGLLLLALLWWAWVGYAWLGTTVNVKDGGIRFGMFTAMAGILVVAIGMPEWFHDTAGGLDGPLSAPVLVALAYVTVRIANLAIYWWVARGNPGLVAAVVRLGTAVAVAGVLVVVGAVVGGTAQVVIVAVAVALDFGGGLLGRGSGWVVSLGHFAERHGLILIIALGESIVAVGVGASGYALSVPIIVGAAIGVAIAGRLWILYFDQSDTRLEHVLKERTGAAQAELARDVYSYLHLLLVAGIVLIALGLKTVLAKAAESGLAYPLPGYATASFAAGIVLFLAGRQLMWARAGLPLDPRTWIALPAAVVLGFAGLVLPAAVTAALGFVVLHIASPVVPERRGSPSVPAA